MKDKIYKPHHYTLYELVPSYISQDGLTHHNTQGFRGPECLADESKSRFRIVCMGESTTYGSYILRDEDAYPAQLQKELHGIYPDKEIEVINAGVPGYTSAENLLRFIFRVEALKPDLVIFYYTHNDVHPRKLPHLSRDYREYSRVWCGCERPWEKMRRRIGALKPLDILQKVRRYREFKKKGLIPSDNILKNGPEHFESNMKSLALLCRGQGIRLLCVNPPYRHLAGKYDIDQLNPVPLAVHQHREIIKKLGKTIGFDVYDLKKDMPYPELDKEKEHDLYFDRVHVNEKGASLMANLISKEIVRLECIACPTPS